MSISPEFAPLPERPRTALSGLQLPPTVQGGGSSQDLLLDGIRDALLLPEAVAIVHLEDDEREKFIQLTSGDDWSLRVEATERSPEKVSRYRPRQSVHVYAFHYGLRLLLESTIEPPEEDEPINEAWGMWGVQRPLSPIYTDMWKKRFWFLLPDSIEMKGEDNYQSFSQGPYRELIRLGITSLLASAHPDVDLTKASRGYWLEKGYTVFPPEPSRAVPEIEGTVPVQSA
jgi:hypothetical protein